MTIKVNELAIVKANKYHNSVFNLLYKKLMKRIITFYTYRFTDLKSINSLAKIKVN
jgi:hypothetical protein